jgi:polyisoprenoid-binding protein YceI
VTGDLTIKAITRQIDRVVRFGGIINDPWGNTRAAFQAIAKVNRKDFNLLADLECDTGGLPVARDVVLKIATETIFKK